MIHQSFRRFTFVALLFLGILCFCHFTSSATSSSSSHRTRSSSPLFSSRPNQYASKYIKAIEPLQYFHVTHSDDEIPLAGFHPEAPAVDKVETGRRKSSSIDTEEQAQEDAFSEYSESDLAHWTVNGAPHSYHKGQAQLYPDKIQLHFRAFDEKHTIELHIIRNLYNEHSHVTLFEGGEIKSEHPHVLQSYWSRLPDGSGFATATLHRDGGIQAVIHHNADTIQIDPVHIHKQEMDDHTYTALHKAAHHPKLGHVNMKKGHAVHKHSDFNKDRKKTHRHGGCNVGELLDQVKEDANISSMVGDDEDIDSSNPFASLTPIRSARRRLFQAAAITNGYGNFPQVAPAISKWTNCWYGDNKAQQMPIGFAVDTGMYEVWGSVAGFQQYLAWQMSVINLVYLTQLNIFLSISDVYIESVISTTAAAWNDKPPYYKGKCPITISNKLATFSQWRNDKVPTKNGLWQLQTNCYPPSGTVGLAWINTLCSTYYGTSIITYYSNQWLTTAHEFGHNFGASHTFQLGQGKTGSIMDYADGKLDGQFQFSTQYSKSEMCYTLSTTSYFTSSFTPYCVAPFTPTCGNGVMEPGEACDDKSSCCGQPGSATPCQLTSQAQCSGETPCCSGCKYKPSTTSCMAGNGYCQNGFCAPSTCTGYGQMSFCGMVSANPCRQQCANSNPVQACTDAYSAPNLNVPDGIVCSTAPYSTCQSGQCVSSGGKANITYSWSTSDWGVCSCTGSQTRAAYCLGSDGSKGTEGTQCTTASKPSLAKSCTIPQSCMTYNWTVSTWTGCTFDCGSGTQSATVQCIVTPGGTVVADASCSAISKPLSSRACNTQACPVSWLYGGWSQCSSGCGGGSSTRTAVCQLTQNSITKSVADSWCSGIQVQSTSGSCNTQPCVVVAPTITYSLTYGVWSVCSLDCGGGSQSRPAYCIGSDGVTYGLAKCNCGPGTANAFCPGSVQACNTQLCPSYAWSSPSWSGCSVGCGGGIQTRTVLCMNTVANVAVPAVNCLTAQPSSVQSCNTASCVVYKWAAGLWLPCTTICGGGVQTRPVSCVTDANIVAQASQCSNLTVSKPLGSQSCNLQTCPTYQWLLGAWSTCSAWCGGGTQTRTVKCVAVGSLTPVSYSNCDTANIPATAQYCNQAVTCPLNSDVQWQLTSWSNCSQVCGGEAIRNRTVACTNTTTGLEVDAKLCPKDYIPEVTSTCPEVKCPTYWFTSEWSTCSADCNGGSQSRTVECRYVNNGTVKIDDALCTGTRPSQSADCNLFPCPQWQVQPWGACSTRCNDGIQTRQIFCVTWDNQNTTVDACSSAPLPPSTQTCVNKPCPHWHRGPWSYCDKVCGTGQMTRELVCRMPHDSIWHGQVASDPSLCPPVGSGDSGDGVGDSDVIFGKPATTSTCNELPCPTYYWDIINWSSCSAECGGGAQDGDAVCRSSTDNSKVESNLCLGTPPTNKRVCNVDPCPVWQWMATSDWSECSVDCGVGVQTREVHCANMAPAEWKHVQFDITQDETKCAGQVKVTTIQPCSFPKSICIGTTMTSSNDSMTVPTSTTTSSLSTTPNGLCTSEGVCLCRAGYGGRYCSETPKITNVLTNGAGFGASGIPFGDTLQIQWQSTTSSLPFVSILLQRLHAADSSDNWPVPSYIAKDVINTGTYSWNVGERLPDLESGDGFTVRVWFSPTIYGENLTPFTIADPCDYKSCGIHGTCGVGGVCTCVAGYSGETCAVGPCERAHCSTSFGSCNNDDYIGLPTTTSETVGTCLCGQSSPGQYFDGAQCRTPPGCTPRCQNGADLYNVIVDINSKTSEQKGQCGICGCINMWQGDNCETCGLECKNGGVSNSECSQCDCTSAPGYFGSTCGCKYYTLTLRLNLLESSFINPSLWITDPLMNARFSRTLASDIALASGQVTGLNIEVNVVELTLDTSTQNSLLAKVHLGLECPILSDENIGSLAEINGRDEETLKSLHGILTHAASKEGAAFNNLLSQRTVRNVHSSVYYPRKAGMEVKLWSDYSSKAATATGLPSLLSIYTLLSNMFEDLSSPLYRGVITRSVILASVVDVKDESGEDSPRVPGTPTDPFVQQQITDGGDVGTDSSSSSSKLGLIIGIAVGAAVLLFLCCLFALYVFKISGHKMIHSYAPGARASSSTVVKGPDDSEAGLSHQEIQLATTATSSAVPSAMPSVQSSPHTTPPKRGSRRLSLAPVLPPSQRTSMSSVTNPSQQQQQHLKHEFLPSPSAQQSPTPADIEELRLHDQEDLEIATQH